MPRPTYVFSPKLQEERKKLKKSFFKPKHFEFYHLEIGNYKVQLLEVVHLKTENIYTYTWQKTCWKPADICGYYLKYIAHDLNVKVLLELQKKKNLMKGLLKVLSEI